MTQLLLPVPAPAPVVAMPQQATHDAELIDMWLHGRPENTRRAYERHTDRFLTFAGKPLAQITVRDLQGFVDTLGYLAPRSRNQALSAVKSLLSYGQVLGYLVFNVGAVVRLEKVANDLAERILQKTRCSACCTARNTRGTMPSCACSMLAGYVYRSWRT
jgi:site-specific recombinase XerD